MAWEQLSLDVAVEFARLRVDQEIAAHVALVSRTAFTISNRTDPRTRGMWRHGDGPSKFDRRTGCKCRKLTKERRCAKCVDEYKRCKSLRDRELWQQNKNNKSTVVYLKTTKGLF